MDPYTHIGSPRDPHTCGHSYRSTHTYQHSRGFRYTRAYPDTYIRIYLDPYTHIGPYAYTQRTPPHALPDVPQQPPAPALCPCTCAGLMEVPELLPLGISTLTLAATITSPLQVVPALGQSSACRFAGKKPPGSHGQEQTPCPFPPSPRL